MTVGCQYAEELHLFENAINWKRYWTRQIRPYIGRTVLEVGAGTGSNTPLMLNAECRDWLCLEPSPELAAKIPISALPPCVRVACGTIRDLEPRESFDTIVYIDVLEHIENDRAELAMASQRLDPGGALIVLAPAHQALFSPFDAAVGHYRRYSRETLLRWVAPGLALERLRYLDCMGVLASAANRWLLAARRPTPAQIKIWDRLMVPISRIADPLLGWRVGKSILAIWRRSRS